MKKSYAPYLKFVLNSVICCAQLRPALALASPPDLSVATTPMAEVVLTEILANAVNESTGEFIELLNQSDSQVDLALYRFTDNSGVTQSFVPFPRSLAFGTPGTVFEPDALALVLDKDYAGEYDQKILESVADPAALVLLTTSQGYLSLANSVDQVTVSGPTGVIQDAHSWTSDAGSEIPFARTRLLSDELGPLAADSAGLSPGFVRAEEILPQPEPPNVLISEVLPDPVGSDEAEFIEINNRGAASVDLATLLLRDQSGTQYHLGGDLAPGAYAFFGATASKIALNNSGDSVALVFSSPAGEQIIDTVVYAAANEGQSWARFDGTFAWTTQPTPGAENILIEPPTQNPLDDPTETEDPATDEEKELSATNDSTGVVSVAAIAEALKLSSGTRVQIKAIVTTSLGVYFPKYFHVQDDSAGLLVKLAAEDASAKLISPGTQLELVGKLSTYRDMPRLVLSEAPKKTGRADITPIKRSLEKITDQDIGRLITTSGQVATRSGRSFRLAQGQTKMLVSVRAGTGITAKAPAKGSRATVTGLVLRSGEQLVLAPRSTADLNQAALLPSGSPATPLGLLALLGAGATLVYQVRLRSRAGSIKKF